MKQHLLIALASGLLMMTASLQARAQDHVDWPTYGMDSLRTGYNPYETILSPETVNNLRSVWKFDPGTYEVSIDPSVDPTNASVRAQPIFVHGVLVGGKKSDLVLIGDNNGYFFALHADTTNPRGAVLWYRYLSTSLVPSCDEVLGVQATGAVDRTADGGSGAVYIGLNGQMHGLSLTDGAELPGWPVAIPLPAPPHTDRDIRDGANIVDGKLYIGTSSHCDQAPYYGRLVKIDLGTAKVTQLWYTMTGTSTPPAATVWGGGIWGWGGVSVDPDASAGGVYIGTGNHLGAPQQQVYAEEIVNLNRELSTVAGVAGPTIPPGDNDYGSTPVVFQPTGCSTKLLAVLNKTGLLVLEKIGAGGKLTLLQSLKIALNTTSFLGMVAWDPVDQLLLLTTPTDGHAPYLHGLNALRIAPACGRSSLSFAWQTTKYKNGTALPTGTMSSPTVANGLAWFGVGVLDGSSPSRVFAVATANGPHYSAGQIMWQSAPLLCAPRPAAPTVVDGRVFASCVGSNARVYAFALPGS